MHLDVTIHGHGEPGIAALDYAVALVMVAAAALYLGGLRAARGQGRSWPLWRTACWVVGLLVVTVSMIGPLATAGHESFTAHMLGHLLAGMVAPIFLVVAAPVTLALRALDVRQARRLSRLLRSRPARFLVHPVTAAVINVGSLWLLYTTQLYELMQSSSFFHLLVTAHFVIAGYLLVASLIGVDPNPHRAGYPLRAVVLVAALAGHGILSKYLYAHPPAGVSLAEAQSGSVLMYYGGDVADAALIVILCLQWYRAAGKTRALEPGMRASG
ncbi:cytochrome c oxidase assembly protein [Mycetocola zhujimingii]|nr:cytochrome c oxidase assembly protein [Mycetocola zhujimingii]